MLKALLMGLKSSDWGKALDFLSPRFFEVVPALGMSRLITQLIRNSRNRALELETRERWALGLSRLDPSLSLGPSTSPAGIDAPGLGDSYTQGQTLLKLYFASILAPDSFYLDLRFERFKCEGALLLWQPKVWIHAWTPSFRDALLKIYQGYYGEQAELFREGLKALRLEHAEELFLEIFGNALHESQVFRLDQFRSAFHKVFVSCLEHKTQLHPEFLALGMLLFGLYEHAERLNAALRPKLAWQDAWQWRFLSPQSLQETSR